VAKLTEFGYQIVLLYDAFPQQSAVEQKK